MDNSLQTPPENKNNLLVWVLAGIFLLALLLGLFFAGSFIYSLGQRNAAQLAGVDLTPHPTETPTVYLTPTVTPTITLTPTATDYVVFPTATATKIPWTSCPGIVITVSDTSKGDILHVLRCEDNFEYDLGPLAKGFYAVSPDDKYLVYCTADGMLYASKIGSTNLHLLMNVKREGEFVIFNKKAEPNFVLRFAGGPPAYVLNIYELNYNQNLSVTMPGWLDE